MNGAASLVGHSPSLSRRVRRRRLGRRRAIEWRAGLAPFATPSGPRLATTNQRKFAISTFSLHDQYPRLFHRSPSMFSFPDFYDYLLSHFISLYTFSFFFFLTVDVSMTCLLFPFTENPTFFRIKKKKQIAHECQSVSHFAPPYQIFTVSET